MDAKQGWKKTSIQMYTVEGMRFGLSYLGSSLQHLHTLQIPAFLARFSRYWWDARPMLWRIWRLMALCASGSNRHNDGLFKELGCNPGNTPLDGMRIHKVRELNWICLGFIWPRFLIYPTHEVWIETRENPSTQVKDPNHEPEKSSHSMYFP